MFDQIMTYVDIGMWCLVLFGILIAFLRGFKKDFNNMMAVITIIILCYIFSPLLAKLIANLDISWIIKQPGPISLLSKVKELISDSLGITVENGSVLDDYLTALAIAVINIPVYLFLLFNSLFTIRFLFRLIFKAIPVPKGKSFGGRCAGVFLQLITIACVLFFGFGIIFGVEGLLQDVVEYSQYIESPNSETVSDDEFNIQKLGEYIEIVDSKPFFKMVAVCSGHNHKAEAHLLGNLCKIKTKNATLNLVKEKDAYLPLVPTIVEISQNDDPTSIINIVIKNRETLINTLKKSNIFEFVMPALVEILEQKTDIENLNYEDLKTIKWKNEKEDLLDIVDEILKIMGEANYNYEDYKSILADQNLSGYLKRIGKKIDESNLIKKIILPFADSKILPSLDEKLPDALKPLKEVLVISKLNFQNDLEIAGHVLNDLFYLGIFDEGNINILDQKDTIFDLVEQIFNLSLIKNNEETIFTALINYLDLDTKLSEFHLTIETSYVDDWDNEIEIFKHLISTIFDIMNEKNINFESDELTTLFSDIIEDERLKSIISDICHSELLNHSIIPLIDTILTNMNLKEYESDYFISLLNGDEEFDPELIINDLYALIDIVNDIKELNLTEIDFKTISNEDIDKVQDLIISINNMNLLKIDKVVDYINDFLANMDYESRVLSMWDKNNNGTTKDEWNEEIPRLIDIIKQIKDLNMDNETLLENHEVLGNALNQMKDSHLFGNNTHNDLSSPDDDIFNKFMVESLIKMSVIGENGFVDETLARSADWTIYDYSDELEIISKYDFEKAPEEQSDDTIKALQYSEIIHDFYDLSTVVNSKIDGVEIILVDLDIIILKEHVNNGQALTKDDLYNSNWADELDDMNRLIEAFDEANSDTGVFKQRIEMLSNSDKNTYAKDAAISIKNKLSNKKIDGIPIWNLL